MVGIHEQWSNITELGRVIIRVSWVKTTSRVWETISVTLCKVQSIVVALGYLSMDCAKPGAMQEKSRGNHEDTRERKEVNSCAG